MIRWALRRAIDVVSRVTHMIAAAVLAADSRACRTGGRTAVGPAARRQCLHFDPRAGRGHVAVVVGLSGAVVGGLALARSARRIGTGNGRRGAIVALVLGPIGLVIGGLVVATADGGLGTGNGLGGGIVAMMVGLIGMALGGLALARSRRTA